MKFFLIVAKGSKKGLPIPVTADLFLMGSDKMCQLRAARFPPEQCALVTRENKVYVRDMGSKVPTLVNGSVITSGSECPLHVGDRLEIGNLEFVIQFREKNLSQKDLEEWAAHCLDDDETRIIREDDDFFQPTNASEAAAALIGKLSAQRGLIKGRLRIGYEKDITLIRFTDNKLVEDSEITFIKRELCDNLNRPNLRVLLDCKNVERMSTAAVTMIREFYRWLKPWGSKLAVCRLRSDLSGVLPALEEDLIPYYHDKKLAIAARW